MSVVGPELLARLLDEHGSALKLYARSWCDTPDDAVQEALLQLVRQPTVPEKLAPWLYRVVRNAAISQSRSARRRRRHEAAAAGQAAEWFVPRAADRLDAREAAHALELLTSEQREIIVARLWGGLSFQEIAEVVGTSSSSAHRRYEAGLAALRERLGSRCQTNDLKE